MHFIGKIDREIYKCITKDIVTDEIVITENQIYHILERHPETYNSIMGSLNKALNDPDFIIEDKHVNTGLIIKKVDDTRKNMQIVLRICTSSDPNGYKNSIISCWFISDKRLENYLRNKKILYKKA